MGGQGGRSLRGRATAALHNMSCHNTVEGESCYTAVVWAMEHGIVLHPEWYPDLHGGSTFAEFQAHMVKINHGGCDYPCDICHTAKPGSQCHTAVTWAMEHGVTLHPEYYGNLSAGATFEEFQRLLHLEGKEGCPWPCPGCHTTLPNETCHAGVVWAMEHGIHMHPENPVYSGLDAHSSFVDFQAALNRHKIDRCPEPCGVCHTSVEGERCYEGVMWARNSGIRIHPEWYPDLTTNSSFEAIQAHLHRSMKTWSLPGDVEIKAFPATHVALCVWRPATRYCTDDQIRYLCRAVVVTRNSSHQQRVTSQKPSILR